MYKVLIVDDEKEVCEGLAYRSWEAVGLQVAGCRSHKLEALQFVANMPSISGFTVVLSLLYLAGVVVFMMKM